MYNSSKKTNVKQNISSLLKWFKISHFQHDFMEKSFKSTWKNHVLDIVVIPWKQLVLVLINTNWLTDHQPEALIKIIFSQKFRLKKRCDWRAYRLPHDATISLKKLIRPHYWNFTIFQIFKQHPNFYKLMVF